MDLAQQGNHRIFKYNLKSQNNILQYIMLQFFVIFHKYIFDECYKDIPQHILDTYFTFVAVNPDIEKHYTQGKYRVINEWELPIYNSNLQKDGFQENSAIYHIYVNKLHAGYDHIGLLQYDMVLPSNYVETVLEKLESHPNSHAFCSDMGTYDFLVKSSTGIIMENVLSDYEKFFNKKFCGTKMYPICNTFIIPVDVFEYIMPWICQIHDMCFKLSKIYYPSSRIYVASVLERAMAMVIGDNLISEIIHLSHDRDLYKKSY